MKTLDEFKQQVIQGDNQPLQENDVPLNLGQQQQVEMKEQGEKQEQMQANNQNVEQQEAKEESTEYVNNEKEKEKQEDEEVKKNVTEDIDKLLDTILSGIPQQEEKKEITNEKENNEGKEISNSEIQEKIDEQQKKVKEDLDNINDSDILKKKYLEINKRYAELFFENQSKDATISILKKTIEQLQAEKNEIWDSKKNLEREIKKKDATSLDSDLAKLNDYYRLSKENSGDIYSVRGFLAEAGKLLSRVTQKDFSPYIISYLKSLDSFNEEPQEINKEDNIGKKKDNDPSYLQSYL